MFSKDRAQSQQEGTYSLITYRAASILSRFRPSYRCASIFHDVSNQACFCKKFRTIEPPRIGARSESLNRLYLEDRTLTKDVEEIEIDSEWTRGLSMKTMLVQSTKIMTLSRESRLWRCGGRRMTERLEAAFRDQQYLKDQIKTIIVPQLMRHKSTVQNIHE